ncbi:hypothetical protein APHAL10511_001492 [Amanita phalloides]|nr:hypothetical protein APHAL10511_001492 [Amanita phalloides]
MALYRIDPTASSRASNRTSRSKKKRDFTSKEYFRITLTSKVAEDATAKVLDAKIEVQTGDGRVHERLGAAKFVLELRKRQKLRHEYHYMALKKVKGITMVYDVASTGLIGQKTGLKPPLCSMQSIASALGSIQAIVWGEEAMGFLRVRLVSEHYMLVI